MAITVILLIIIALFFLRFRVPAMGAATGRATPAQAAQATAAALPKVLLTASPTVPPIAPPEVALPEGGLQIGQNELDGSAPGAGQVQIAIDGEVIGTVAVGPDGAWSLPFVLDQPGTYTLEIRALDGQGQVAARSTAPLYVEKPPVALQARAPSWGEWAPVDDSRSTARLELSGEGKPGIEIEVLDNDAVAGSTTVRDDGTWRFEYEIGAGEHALVVRVSGVASASGDPKRVQGVPAGPTCAFVAPSRESQCPPDPPAGQDNGDTYVVGWCETLGLIARRTGVSVAEILALNPEICNPNLIHQGQVLALPPRE